jgi:hypothetical protein
MNETTHLEVLNVAASIRYSLIEAQIEYVIQNFDEMAQRDPSGDRILWIEQLIYEFDDHCR